MSYRDGNPRTGRRESSLWQCTGANWRVGGRDAKPIVLEGGVSCEGSDEPNRDKSCHGNGVEADFPGKRGRREIPTQGQAAPARYRSIRDSTRRVTAGGRGTRDPQQMQASDATRRGAVAASDKPNSDSDRHPEHESFSSIGWYGHCRGGGLRRGSSWLCGLLNGRRRGEASRCRKRKAPRR